MKFIFILSFAVILTLKLSSARMIPKLTKDELIKYRETERDMFKEVGVPVKPEYSYTDKEIQEIWEQYGQFMEDLQKETVYPGDTMREKEINFKQVMEETKKKMNYGDSSMFGTAAKYA